MLVAETFLFAKQKIHQARLQKGKSRSNPTATKCCPMMSSSMTLQWMTETKSGSTKREGLTNPEGEGME